MCRFILFLLSITTFEGTNTERRGIVHINQLLFPVLLSWARIRHLLVWGKDVSIGGSTKKKSCADQS